MINAENRQSGWRKRIINNKLEKDVYDQNKLFLEAGWYSEEQLSILLNKHKEWVNDCKGNQDT